MLLAFERAIANSGAWAEEQTGSMRSAVSLRFLCKGWLFFHSRVCLECGLGVRYCHLAELRLWNSLLTQCRVQNQPESVRRFPLICGSQRVRQFGRGCVRSAWTSFLFACSCSLGWVYLQHLLRWRFLSFLTPIRVCFWCTAFLLCQRGGGRSPTENLSAGVRPPSGKLSSPFLAGLVPSVHNLVFALIFSPRFVSHDPGA